MLPEQHNKISEKKLSKRGEVAGKQSLSPERNGSNTGVSLQQDGQNRWQRAVEAMCPRPSELIISW